MKMDPTPPAPSQRQCDVSPRLNLSLSVGRNEKHIT